MTTTAKGDADGRIAPKTMLRELRRTLGLTQEGVAARAGLTRVQINKIEGGSNKLKSYATRLLVAAAYGLDAAKFDDLLLGTLSVTDAARLAKRREKKAARTAA